MMRRDPTAGAHARANLDRTLAHVCAEWRKAQQEKQRVIAAMLAAGQQAREAAK